MLGKARPEGGTAVGRGLTPRLPEDLGGPPESRKDRSES